MLTGGDGSTLHTLFDYVLLTSERIVLHNAHSTDSDFHEAEAEMSMEVHTSDPLLRPIGSLKRTFTHCHGHQRRPPQLLSLGPTDQASRAFGGSFVCSWRRWPAAWRSKCTSHLPCV